MCHSYLSDSNLCLTSEDDGAGASRNSVLNECKAESVNQGFFLQPQPADAARMVTFHIYLLIPAVSPD